MEFKYKEKSFLFRPLPNENALFVVDLATQEPVLRCNFPNKNKHAVELMRKGIDEDEELMSSVQNFIRILVDQNRL
jgi:hypothetical protein